MKKIPRITQTVMAIFLLLGSFSVLAQNNSDKTEIPKPLYKVRVEKNVMIPMRDGAKMATDIYFPVGLDKAPAILSRTPYGKNVQSIMGRKDPSRVLAGQGYVVLVQDVRGRFGSEGQFYPFLKDGDDGQDAIAWIQKQAWFNGKLGTYGASYLGTTQWFEAPGEDIAAMHLEVTSPNLKDVLYTGGELHLETIYFWSMVTGDRKNNYKAALRISRINRAINTLPLSKAAYRAGGDVKYFDDALDASKIFDLYRGLSLDQKYNEISEIGRAHV